MQLRASFVSTVAALAALAAADNAVKVTGNPSDVSYKATLSGGGIEGSVEALASTDGRGVKFTVDFSQLPSEGGPFSYHLHVNPVPSDGNCTATGGHLDPSKVGADVTCDPSAPEACQVGDLSGKYGTMDSAPFSTDYLDHYASTKKGDGAFFGDRSVVVHFANGTRAACGNFAKKLASGGNCTDSDHTGMPGGTRTATGTGSGVKPTGTNQPAVTTMPVGAGSAVSVPLYVLGLIVAVAVLGN